MIDTQTMFNIDEIAADLTDDGDKHVIDTDDFEAVFWPQLADGARGTWTFRLRIEPDDIRVCDIEDDEVFGRYECREYLDSDNDRPDGFTGAAVKISDAANQGFYYWYEPPTSLRKFKGSGFTTIEAWEAAKAQNLVNVRNMLSWGYIQIGIEVIHDRADGYTRGWSEWISGVESDTGLWGEPLDNHRAYVTEIVKEQLAEVINQINQETP